MRFLVPTLALLASGLSLVAVTGCRQETVEVKRKLGFDDFVPIYNRHITKYVGEQIEATKKEIAKNDTALAAAQGDAKATLEIHAAALQRELEKWEFRRSIGDFLKTGDPSEVPADLVWENGMDQPEVGDPAAKKGGVIRRHFQILDFPPTIRPFGPNSNNNFRSDLYDNIDLPLVGLHPATMKEIPGIASEWAVTPDGRTVYMKIDPAATYSDGKPIKARDFQIYFYVRCSDNVVNPFTKEALRDNFAQVATYGDHLLSVTLPERTVYTAATAGGLTPSSPDFYADYGPDYAERYQWKFPPTSGAYEVKDEDIVKGVSITQSRVKDWWAKDRKYYRYRFNPDKLVTVLVRDESKAFELFRAGELDTYFIAQPDLWYEKSEIQPIYDGYIEKSLFYNLYPRIPRGLYLNVTKPPLDDRKVRIGIQHAMNWQKVIDVMFRGDYTRLNSFQEGMGVFSDPSIRSRPYSITDARAAFRAAGYTEEGPDGILKKPDGTRLSASVSYQAIPLLDRIFAILREDARACGFDLRTDGLEGTVFYKKIMQKQHEMQFSAWNATPPTPEYYQFLHSSQAFDEKGNPKPQTNNFFVWSRPDTDIMVDKAKYARDEAELRDASWALQKMVHDEAIFVPAYKVPFNRIECWRYVRWPDSAETKFSPPVVYEPHEGYCFWVDEDMQKETMEARRDGKTFPEVNRVIDAYRDEPATQAPPVPAP